MGAEGKLRQWMGAVLLGCTSSSSHFNPNFCSTNSITRLTKSTIFLIFSSLLSLLNSISARMMKLKPISRPLTLVLTLLTIAYGMFVAFILSNKPLHHLLFESPPPPPMMMMNQSLAIAQLLRLHHYHHMRWWTSLVIRMANLWSQGSASTVLWKSHQPNTPLTPPKLSPL